MKCVIAKPDHKSGIRVIFGIKKTSYTLKIKSQPFEELDQFALLASQDYNLGKPKGSDWFYSFRGGLYGVYARVYGIGEHYRLLHAWLPPRVHLPEDTEYHLTSVLFNMDSALECLTFALNALGNGAQPEGFLDVSDPKKLSGVSRRNILGDCPPQKTKKNPLKGYSKIFPNLQSHWVENRKFLGRIFDLHNVSKHRETIYESGRLGSDPLPGYFDSLGLRDDSPEKILYQPHETILLRHEPKVPKDGRTPIPWEDHDTLERIAPDFLEFLQKSGDFALNDARANIKLKHSTFQTTSAYKPFPFNHVPGGVWE